MTLLEVIVAMIIISVIATMGLVAYNGAADDKALRRAAIEVEALASKGHTRAFLRQIPHRLALIDAHTVVLQALNQAVDDDSFLENATYTDLDRFTTSEIQIAFRRWGAKHDQWINPQIAKESNDPIYWDFSPAGICEPVAIRFTENQNWIILEMDPLTARTKEQESYISK